MEFRGSLIESKLWWDRLNQKLVFTPVFEFLATGDLPPDIQELNLALARGSKVRVTIVREE